MQSKISINVDIGHIVDIFLEKCQEKTLGAELRM